MGLADISHLRVPTNETSGDSETFYISESPTTQTNLHSLTKLDSNCEPHSNSNHHMSNNYCRDLVLYDRTLEFYKALVLKAPTSLQTGERWINIDHILNLHRANVPLVIVYDIACQYRPHMCPYPAETDWANCAP
ncbi:hypothetical protein B0H13DRAFT_2318013 [Mycena leptocephala]|nr:hypothetical protein B0H13DRAFT_2368537 [Mycena leptocephala]KAJ7921892.1 hypothetical protein B0H13DRAFT_2318013 [Mycena leptocephala]